MLARLSSVIGLLLAASATAQEPIPVCMSQLATPVYPPLAKQARVQGIAELKFRVTAEGLPVDVVTSGHKLLAPAAARVAEDVWLDPTLCGSREFTVTYRFVIDLAGDRATTEVAYVAPNEFRVTSIGGGEITCILYANTESRFRRTLRRILHR